MSKDILGNDIEELNVRDLINALGINRAFAEKVEEKKQQYCELLDKHTPEFSAEIKKTLEANPGGQEDDNPQQDRDSQATLPRENSQGERNGENNHNKKHRDSNPGRQEDDNRQQGKWKKNRDSQRENSQGERNGENRLTENNRTPHQNADTAVNINPITTLGENIKQKLQRNKWYIAILLGFSLWLPVSNTLNSWKKKNPKKVTTEQKDSIKRDSESETIDKVSATGELSHFVKEGESMYSIVTNLKSSWKLSGISSVREDIIREACEKEIIMKIKEGQTTKEKFDPRNLSPGDVIVIKIKEFENLHRQ